MRLVTLILLVVLAFTVLAPMTSFTLISVNDGRSFLGNLDVCHAAAPALSSNGEMPCVSASPCSSGPIVPVSSFVPAPQFFVELLLSTRNEQPPRS
jgi:hypothetical protein